MDTPESVRRNPFDIINEEHRPNLVNHIRRQFESSAPYLAPFAHYDAAQLSPGARSTHDVWGTPRGNIRKPIQVAN